MAPRVAVVDSAAAATRQWIREFVVREKLCPFAAPSRVDVYVETWGFSPDDLHKRSKAKWALDLGDSRLVQPALRRARDRIDALFDEPETDDNQQRSLFLVWPVGFQSWPKFDEFSGAVVEASATPSWPAPNRISSFEARAFRSILRRSTNIMILEKRRRSHCSTPSLRPRASGRARP
ncbi:hypothetical protein M885DRAFT_545723 [Pelagophyceae sp. CCMP2097]|nr:hypothetical protein M885DRAFT_545723 [Pelagophyceae sp. CCMP2097]